MHEILKLQTSSQKITQFDPHVAKPTISALDAAIRCAQEMQEWEAGMEAARLMVEEQRKFVEWWDINVGARKGQFGGKGLKGVDPRLSITKDQAEADTHISHQQVSKWRKGLKKPDYVEAIFMPGWRKAMAAKDNVRGTQGTGENEWYTPAEYIEIARGVLGGIDLDPASSERAQETVKAARFFTAENNGLQQPWHGRVWLNPPYAQPHIADFATKMVEQVDCGNVRAAIMLTHNYTDTAWFQKLALCADAICFSRGRIRFISPDDELASPTQGQAFFYFGPDAARFCIDFHKYGFVVPHSFEVT